MIAIHVTKGSYSDRWVQYCVEHGLHFTEVDCLDTGIMARLRSVEFLLWHWTHLAPAEVLCASRVIKSAEMMGLNVFPDTATCWHYDDKVAQKYLLESVGAELVPSYIFYDLDRALAWIDQATFPKVFKLSRGAGSLNVRLVRGAAEARQLAVRAFGRGFIAANILGDVRAKAGQHRRKGNIPALLARLPRTLWALHKVNRAMPIEKSYIYFQDFVPGNVSDTRVTIIGDRAFSFTRNVRPNDFRASGSGSIDYDLARIDLRCVRMAFDVAGRLGTQSLAFDFVKDTQGRPWIVEISYCYLAEAVHACAGHWDSKMNWHEGRMWPQDAILIDLLERVSSGSAGQSLEPNRRHWARVGIEGVSMCGIAGIYRFDGRPVDPDVLERMKRSLVHRGPDDEGLLLRGPLGLSHNRLSILDLSEHGHQPMEDAKAGNWIVYNGEIYNFQEVRRDLEALGCRFRSTGDTEVILYAYREWGPACLDRFNGMFAFAIYNERDRTLFAARDRLGIKPLYYYVDDRQLVFASETKAVLLAEGVPRRIRRDALPEFVAFRYLANGRTLFEDIQELRPGHWLEAGPEGVRVRTYWDIAFRNGEERRDDHWREGLRDKLRESVRYQLISDVPVGCALSGGVDSSLVTALACEAALSTMKTFTIGFESADWDERGYARQVSDALGVENYAQVLTQQEFWERLPKLIWHMDEPINHPNSVGIWMLAKLARQKVTVLLTGEGGDELMGGYDRFRTVLRFRRLRRMVPGSGTAARLLPSGMSGRKGRVVRELARDDDGLMIWSSAYMPSQYVQALFGPGAVERAESERRALLAAAPADDPVRRHLYLEQKTYLASVLIRNDKMLMAESMEGRVPFLDHTVVEYAAAMPSRLKVDRLRSKIVLFDLAEERLGRELFQRPKSGFGVPTAYFHGKGDEYLKDLILGRSFRQRELMNPKAVEELLKLHESGQVNLAEGVWILAMLELWARTFIDR